MDDLISRQQAIEAVKKNTFRLTFAEEQNCEGRVAWSTKAVYSELMEEALLDIPAQPEQRWIPCGKRLPEEGEVVLTQAKFKDDVKMAVSSRIDYNYWTTWGTRDINIIAWMPLPEPYQEGGE